MCDILFLTRFHYFKLSVVIRMKTIHFYLNTSFFIIIIYNPANIFYHGQGRQQLFFKGLGTTDFYYTYFYTFSILL